MKRVLLIILLHLSLFFIVFAYQAQAHAEDEEWTIDSLETMAYARVSGEVIHGDNLNFFIDSRDCLLYTSPSPRDRSLPRMPSSA